MIITCRCGQKNRIPSLPTARVRCGKCQHMFTPQELVKAVPEAPRARTAVPTEDDNDQEDPADVAICGKCKWTGSVDDCEMDDNDRYRCPDCNSSRLKNGEGDPVNE